MKRKLILFVLCLNFCSETSSSLEKCSRRPNIIFIVADDAGWNDFSFHGSSQIPTPNIDALALNGVILNNYYASPLCTPTRGSILTGKHPIHIRLQHYVITGGMVDGLPLDEKLLPQYLKDLGYSTHLVGKWHLGHARHVYTPTFRGFDSHYGNWLGLQDYYDHFYKEKLGFGYDLRRNMEVDYAAFGNYTTDLYTKEAIRVIQNHPTESPLFLMINHIAPHSANEYQPLQAPEENIRKFSDSIEFLPRRIYAGMVDKLDESIGNVIEALELAGILENSIIVFTSDNGGSPEGHGDNYGSNWPLRGVKNSLWEGGTRVAGFIWSKFLPQRVLMGLMHVQDWLPTLYEAAGGNSSNLDVLDGVSQWGTFLEKEYTERTEFLYNIDDIYNNSAFRSGKWKVLQVQFGGLVGIGRILRYSVQLCDLPGWPQVKREVKLKSGNEILFVMVLATSAPSFSQIVHIYTYSAMTPSMTTTGQMRGNVTNMDLGVKFHWDSWYGPSGRTQNTSVHTLIPRILNSTAGRALSRTEVIFNLTLLQKQQDEADVKCTTPELPTPCDPYTTPCLFDISTDPCEYNNLATQHPEILSRLLLAIEQLNTTALPPLLRYNYPEAAPRYWSNTWTNWKDKVSATNIS